MRKAQIAEWILALFTTRERAASTTGDLIENASDRGPWVFWWGISRTALSLAWRSFAAEPSFMAGVGFRGLLVNLSLIALLFTCIIFLAALSGILAGLHVTLSIRALRWTFTLLARIAPFWIQFQTGRWIARRAQGREMAACFAFLIMQAIATPVIGEALFGSIHLAPSPGVTIPPFTYREIIINNLEFITALIAGAIRVRSQFNRQSAH